MLDNHGAAERTSAVAHHILEYAELLGSELDIFVVARHLPANAVEQEFTHLKALWGRLAAAQQCPNARQKLDECEGLDKIIVGAELQPLDAIFHRVAGAENQNRWAHLAVSYLLQNLQ